MKALRILRNIVLALLGLALLLLVALQVILRPKVLTPLVNRSRSSMWKAESSVSRGSALP